MLAAVVDWLGCLCGREQCVCVTCLDAQKRSVAAASFVYSLCGRESGECAGLVEGGEWVDREGSTWPTGVLFLAGAIRELLTIPRPPAPRRERLQNGMIYISPSYYDSFTLWRGSSQPNSASRALLCYQRTGYAQLLHRCGSRAGARAQLSMPERSGI